MRIAAFGATGGVGRFVVKHALDRGHEVRCAPTSATLTSCRCRMED